MKYSINQKTNSIISLFGGKTKEELLKRYLFFDLHGIKEYFNFKQLHFKNYNHVRKLF